jgi:hypothetical protein
MLIIDSKKIIPAPFVTLTKNIVNSADGRPLSSNFQVVLKGTLLPDKGSPTSSGTWHTTSGYPNNENITTDNGRFGSILSKQEALREVFSQPGKLLEYGPSDGTPAVLAYVKTANFNFVEGPWVDRCDYTITLDTTEVNKQNTGSEDSFGDFDNKYITQASDNIQIVESEDGSGAFTVTRTISAVGTASYDNPSSFSNSKEPWENAKEWVVSKLDSGFTSYIVDATLQQYNKRRTETIDKLSGSYSITTVYLYNESNDASVNNYDISIQYARSQNDDLDTGQNIQVTYTINGSIQGFDTTIDQDARIVAAENAFNIFEPTIPSILGLNSDHLYITKNISKNRINGIFSYNITYTNYPTQNYSHIYSITDNKNSGSFSNVSIQGTITGFTIDGSINDAYTNVINYWNSIKNNLNSLISTYAGITVNTVPLSLAIGYNKSSLQISYSAAYNYTDDDNPVGGAYFDTYEVSITDGGITTADKRNIKNSTANIVGNIIGFSNDGVSTTKYNNAKNRYDSIKTQLKNRIESVLGISVSDRIISRTESFNKNNGTVNYNYQFSINNNIDDDKIISRQITIDIAKPRRITAVQIIPGLETGPIIQDIGTKNEETKTLNVQLVLDVDANENDGETYFNTLVELYKPAYTPYYINNNNVSYSVDTGAYNRTITWIYRT